MLTNPDEVSGVGRRSQMPCASRSGILEDGDDLAPRSSPSTPGSAKSSASPTSTAFPPGATTTKSPTKGVTSTTSPPAGVTTTANPTAQPVVATSVLSSTTLVSSVLNAGTPTIPTSIASSTVRQTKSDATASAIPANGIAEKGGNNGGGGGGGISKTAIGFGVVGGIGFLVAVGFLIYKSWWCRRKKANDQAPRAELRTNDNTRPGVGPGGLKRSDSSALGSLMGHAYRAEDGSTLYKHQVGGTYMNEKRGFGTRDDQDPILPREPDPAAHPANNDRSESPVGSWLKRQSSHMLNPLTARASMTSSAAGGFKMTEPPRPDDSASQWGGDAAPPTLDPRFQPPMPAMPPQYQPQQAAVGEYYYPSRSIRRRSRRRRHRSECPWLRPTGRRARGTRGACSSTGPISPRGGRPSWLADRDQIDRPWRSVDGRSPLCT
ncbi:hypothetical protein PG994_003523 [Apiospora phragmitis]|uniref:Uncharacterized protein n=1 Tax=Apiospora phragmitis TaxID=2905665 RepID=A0ABR1W115_9PEZI